MTRTTAARRPAIAAGRARCRSSSCAPSAEAAIPLAEERASNDDVLRQIEHELDLREAAPAGDGLDSRYEAERPQGGPSWQTPAVTSRNSTSKAGSELKPSGHGCKECLESGGEWVHLRLCMSCGHVGRLRLFAQQARDQSFPPLAPPGRQSVPSGRGLGHTACRRSDDSRRRRPSGTNPRRATIPPRKRRTREAPGLAKAERLHGASRSSTSATRNRRHRGHAPGSATLAPRVRRLGATVPRSPGSASGWLRWAAPLHQPRTLERISRRALRGGLEAHAPACSTRLRCWHPLLRRCPLLRRAEQFCTRPSKGVARIVGIADTPSSTDDSGNSARRRAGTARPGRGAGSVEVADASSEGLVEHAVWCPSSASTERPSGRSALVELM